MSYFFFFFSFFRNPVSFGLPPPPGIPVTTLADNTTLFVLKTLSRTAASATWSSRTATARTTASASPAAPTRAAASAAPGAAPNKRGAISWFESLTDCCGQTWRRQASLISLSAVQESGMVKSSRMSSLPATYGLIGCSWKEIGGTRTLTLPFFHSLSLSLPVFPHIISLPLFTGQKTLVGSEQGTRRISYPVLALFVHTVSFLSLYFRK